MADRDVSILILASNKAEVTARCLPTLLHSNPRPAQVVLVDNGSRDQTPEVLQAFQARAREARVDVEILALPENRGAIIGRNLGMERLSGAYWAFLDNDVLVRSRSWLETLRTALEADPQAGVAAPKLLYARPPHLIQCAGCDVTYGGQIIFRGRGEQRDAPAFQTPLACPALISACWMLKASAAREIGPLDELFSPVQFEDIDYCFRLREAGYRCLYVPSVEMYHFENVTSAGAHQSGYAYLTVKHGLKFKKKWAKRLKQPGMPPDSAWSWRNIPPTALEDVPAELELLP
jgi:GT2 family glycosyltransferase